MIDTHAHINVVEYENDVEEVIINAYAKNVLGMLVVGIDIETSLKAIALSKKYNNLFPTAGVHPNEVDKFDLRKLESIINSNKIYAIGECGIDLFWTKENLKKQIQVFDKHIELAVMYDLPIIVHTRDAFYEVYSRLLPYKGKIRGVFHCFSGSVEQAKKALDLGFYLGIGGMVTFGKFVEFKDIVKRVNIKRLLLETDCPYLAPTPFRGKRNEPAYLEYTIAEIAAIKNLSIEEVDEVTTKNAIELFKLEIKLWIAVLYLIY